MEGEWVAGCRQGQGISLYSNGNIFEGEWEGDKVGRQERIRMIGSDGNYLSRDTAGGDIFTPTDMFR